METIIVVYVHQTDSAILVYDTDPDEKCWLQKSQIEFDNEEMDCAREGDELEINIPLWLAEKNNLI